VNCFASLLLFVVGSLVAFLSPVHPSAVTQGFLTRFSGLIAFL
jgi:hypothetical protein